MTVKRRRRNPGELPLIITMVSDTSDIQRRADQVKDILQSPNLYNDNGEALGILESFLEDQMNYPQFYNLDSNLAILKLYLIFPNHSKPAVIRKVLTKALMHLPATDFDFCLSQIPLTLQGSDQTIRALVAAESRLQTCRFREFWQLLASEQELVSLSNTADLKNSIRRFMAGVISLAYHSITIPDSAQLLDLPPSGLQQFCQEHLGGQWVCDEKAGTVTIAKSVDSVTLVANKQPTRSLFVPDTLNDCLSSLKRMQQPQPNQS